MTGLRKKLGKLVNSPLSWAFVLGIAASTVMASCGGGGSSGGFSGGGGTSSSSSSSSSASSSSSSAFTGALVSIDAGANGQTISGWEITPRFWEFDKANDKYDGSWLASRDAIVDHLISDAGISRVRVELRSGVENTTDYWSQFVNGTIGYAAVKSHFYEKINDNSDPNVANAAGFQWSSFDYYIDNFVIPLKTKLAAKGQTLTVNLCFVDFGWTALKGNISLADNPQEYAELVTLAAKRLHDKYGITVDTVEIILEPDNTDHWTGANIGQGLLALKSRLAANGITPKFIAPSPSSAALTTGILDSMATVPGATAALNVVSYHRYDGSTSADNALSGIRSRAAALGAETAMLEYVSASTHDFFRDMEYGGASAWQSYSAAYAVPDPAPGGAVLYKMQDGTIALTQQWRQLGLLQREIRPGARARHIVLPGPDLGLAFQNPDGSDVVAIYSPSGNNFKISGGAKTTYTATFSDANSPTYTTQTVTKGSDGTLLVTVPAGQVVVLHSTG